MTWGIYTDNLWVTDFYDKKNFYEKHNNLAVENYWPTYEGTTRQSQIVDFNSSPLFLYVLHGDSWKPHYHHQ